MHRVLAGLAFDGAHVTEVDDAALGAADVGQAVLGPAGLLADLELRLGLLAPSVSASLRIARYSVRVAACAARGRFYSQSHAVDPWGTSRELLSWRDDLVLAGWDGDSIASGGPRLDAIHEIESQRGLPVPMGFADQLVAVERELREAGDAPYDELRIVDDETLWPHRWRSIFKLLAERGCIIKSAAPSFAGPFPDTDLGRLQTHIATGSGDARPRGDGTLLFFRAETTWEVASATAAFLRHTGTADTVIVRGGEHLPLDRELLALRVASPGATGQSPFRPALQVLPLALELAFEPKNPFRLIELLTLPGGPFAGLVGTRLADAVAEMPGIGGDAWEAAKLAIAGALAERETTKCRARGLSENDARAKGEAVAARKLEEIASWFEGCGHDAIDGADKATLRSVAARVKGFLAKRAILYGASDDRGQETALYAAEGQAAAFDDALANLGDEHLSLVRVRQLVEQVTERGHRAVIAAECAGRPDFVDSPGGLTTRRATVVWWNFVADDTDANAARSPWRDDERAALAAAGVHLPDPVTELNAASAHARTVVLAARERLVLVAPLQIGAEMAASHPLWNELVGRMGRDRAAISRITIDGHSLRAVPNEATPSVLPRNLTPSPVSLPPLAMPTAMPRWTIAPGLIAPRPRASASSLEKLLGCPLAHVLLYDARLYPGRFATIPHGPILFGNLGHRLVERLFRSGALTGEPAEARRLAEQGFDELLPMEGATLLLAGRRIECLEVRGKLARSIENLVRLIRASKLKPIDVERSEVIAWGGNEEKRGETTEALSRRRSEEEEIGSRKADAVAGAREIEGRIDLLLEDEAGREVIIDLKWGRGSYVARLAEGTALQLAIYSRLRAEKSGGVDFPRAAYFSLSTGDLLTTERAGFGDAVPLVGPSVCETWEAAEQMVPRVEAALAKGVVPVSGLRASRPLSDELGAPGPGPRFEIGGGRACDYCKLDAICGRRFEEGRVS